MTFAQCAPPMCLFLQQASSLLSDVGTRAMHPENVVARTVVATIARQMCRDAPYGAEGDPTTADYDDHAEVLTELLEDVGATIQDAVEAADLTETWFQAGML